MQINKNEHDWLTVACWTSVMTAQTHDQKTMKSFAYIFPVDIPVSAADWRSCQICWVQDKRHTNRRWVKGVSSCWKLFDFGWVFGNDNCHEVDQNVARSKQVFKHRSTTCRAVCIAQVCSTVNSDGYVEQFHQTAGLIEVLGNSKISFLLGRTERYVIWPQK